MDKCPRCSNQSYVHGGRCPNCGWENKWFNRSGQTDMAFMTEMMEKENSEVQTKSKPAPPTTEPLPWRLSFFIGLFIALLALIASPSSNITNSFFHFVLNTVAWTLIVVGILGTIRRVKR